MRLKSLFLSILVLLCFESVGQEESHYFIPELSVGSIIPNYLTGPRFGIKTGASITYYKNSTLESPTNQYYNYPLLGIKASFYRLGNPSVYGNEINLMPILGLRMKKGMFEWGIGSSYHTVTHRQNELNLSVGSHFNWAFQWIYYRSYPLFDDNNLRIGFGYRHSSNGHTQLPNYGLNSAVFSFSLTPKELKTNLVKKSSYTEKTKSFFVLASSGIGIHELGSITTPVGGEKKLVFSQSLAFGFIRNEHFRLYAGLGTRHYQHYADSIANSPELQKLNVHPNNHFVMGGIEYLIYHVGISVEGGINLSKPFYYHFAKRYQKTEGFKYNLKKIILSRLGLKLYLINNAKKPKHNLYISAHINANLGQADFSEASLGYVYNFK